MKSKTFYSPLYSSKLIAWYETNHRKLPWRETSNPYFIYLSEIILQQTQVKQGLDYYLKFVKNYPSIRDLANASESEILKDWQGLGYYSRARNMHFAAKQILSQFEGTFPNTYDSIKTLKGVGEYTAAAIASFAFKEAHAVLDGNVFRVISRLFGIKTPIDTSIGKKEFQQIANLLLDKKKPDLHNQAIMEFGAMVCKPKNPICESCPLQSQCIAYKDSLITELPIKLKKLKQAKTYYYYLVFETRNQVLIHHRNERGIWQNLYDFYLIEKEKAINSNWQLLLPKSINEFELKNISKDYTHLLTHKKIHAKFIRIELKQKVEFGPSYQWVSKDELVNYAIPKLIENYLNEEGNFLSLAL